MLSLFTPGSNRPKQFIDSLIGGRNVNLLMSRVEFMAGRRTSVRAALLAFALCGLGSPLRAEPAVLKPDAASRHVTRFNAMENETIVNVFPNSEAAAWLQANIPLFECPDASVEEIYYFRWWAWRKHIRRAPDTGDRYALTEFINKPRPISSALGHHLNEGRWLRDQKYSSDDVLYWLRGGPGGQPQGHLHRYSQWLAQALWQRYLVTHDATSLIALLDDLVRDYAQWEKDQRLPGSILFWSFDVRDAMEESISGSRTKKNLRPTLNSYMFGNAQAIAAIARLAGRAEIATEFDQKAAVIKKATLESLWDADAKFFKVRQEGAGLSDARESIGFIPWYFSLPDPGKGYEAAWAQFTDSAGFRATMGITTAERRHPAFRSHGVGTCEWDGAAWPFATSQTLVALANVLRDYPQTVVTSRDYFDAFLSYVHAHRYDGLPYIGEYYDENSGAWLKGRDERSRWYNHSTFADLLISGVVGLRPRADDTLEISPLLPARTWNWFCLDNVPYHGRTLTILWDSDGKRYGRGAGLQVFVDGKILVRSERLERLTATLP